MQAGGGLVQNIHRLTRAAPGQFRSQLDPLGFAAGQGGGGLSQFHIRQAHIIQSLYLVPDGGHILEKRQRLLHGHIQHIVDTLALVFHIQGFPVITFSAADFAGHIYIRQKVHLDLDDAVTAAGFTASALHIEAESSLVVTFGLGIRRGSKQIPDHVKHSGIGGRVGSGRASDGRLVYVDHFIQLLHALNAPVFSRNHPGPVKIPGQMFIQYLVHQRALARTGDTGDTGHDAQGKGHIHILQIIFRSAQHFNIACGFTPVHGYGDKFPAAQVLACDGLLHLHDLPGIPHCHHLSAMGARPGADVYDIVCRQHGILVMFHHHQRVAQIPEMFQSGQQFVVVPLVQADAGLVQDIAHPHQAGADLGSQTDPLCLAAGKCGGTSGQRQVIQSHIQQEFHPGPNLL